MYKNLFISYLLIAISISSYAQSDKAALVNDIYLRAAKMYENDKFEDCLTLLSRAETLAGNPMAKLLYLKIKSLSSLPQPDESVKTELKRVISSFKDVAPAQNFPEVKIQEINQMSELINRQEVTIVQRQLEDASNHKQILEVADEIERQMVLIKTKKWQTVRKQNNDFQNVISVMFSPFYFGKYQITIGQWIKVMGTNPAKNNTCEDCPVENVSFIEIEEFIEKINSASGRKYKLPTSAQWEYTSSQISIKSFSYFARRMDDNQNYTLPVSSDESNKEGVHNTGGNVREWCQDNYQLVLNPPSNREESRIDYVFLDSSSKFTVRGTSWRMKTKLPRFGSDASDIWLNLLCFRGGMEANEKSDDVGFRLCRN